jgi:O-antigen/teichoic acid export membrane protein
MSGGGGQSVLPTSGRGLLKNLVSLAGGYLLVRLISFLTTLYVAKALGPAGFGTLASGLALAVVAGVVANVGLDEYVAREVARGQGGLASTLGDALILKLLAVPVGALGILVCALDLPQAMPLALCLVLYSVLHSYLLLICSIFRGMERMEMQALLLGLQILLIAAGTLVAVQSTHQTLAVAACYAPATAATLVIGYALLVRHGRRPHYRWEPAAWSSLLRTAIPFGLSFVGALLYDRLALVMITVGYGAVAAGWFNAAYTIVLALASIPAILLATVYPRLAVAARGDRRTVAALTSSLTRYTLIIGLALALALEVLAATIVPALYGRQYLPAVPLLRVLAWSLPGIFLTVILVGVLEANDRQWSCAIGIGGAVLAAIPGTLAASRLWGYQGATVAYVACHLTLAGIMVGLVARAVGWEGVQRTLVLPATAAAAATAVLGAAHAWPPLPRLAAVCLTFGAALVLSGALGRSDLALLRGALQGGRLPEGPSRRHEQSAPAGYHAERTT